MEKIGGSSMEKTPKLKEILTMEEKEDVYEFRLNILKSESSLERNYYVSMIQNILKKAQSRYLELKKRGSQ